MVYIPQVLCFLSLVLLLLRVAALLRLCVHVLGAVLVLFLSFLLYFLLSLQRLPLCFLSPLSPLSFLPYHHRPSASDTTTASYSTSCWLLNCVLNIVAVHYLQAHLHLSP